jgi:hypothetical protein
VVAELLLISRHPMRPKGDPSTGDLVVTIGVSDTTQG